MPKYVMRCGCGPATCLAWLGWMNVPDEATALRRSGHAIQNMEELEVAHSVMDHGKIYWEGELEFDLHYRLAKRTRDEYEAWKNRTKMEEMISVTKPKPDFETNTLDVVIEVVIMTSGYAYKARTTLKANAARKWFANHNMGTAEYILRKAKEQMLKGEYKGCQIWYDLEKDGAWSIKFIDVVDEPAPAPDPGPETTKPDEPEELTLF